jgi:hypothetical protein
MVDLLLLLIVVGLVVVAIGADLWAALTWARRWRGP